MFPMVITFLFWSIKVREAEIITPIRSQRPNDIKEWVDYHLAIGFDKITILDNDSTYSIKELLSDYKKVEVRNIPPSDDFNRGITDLYDSLSEEMERTKNFIALIDDDEFIYIKGNKKIKDFLSDGVDVLCLPWRCISSNKPIDHREGTLIETFNYSSRLPEKVNVKSIINFNRCKNVKWNTDGPHLPNINNTKREFALLNGEKVSNGNGNIVAKSHAFYNNMPIYLYHYFYQSFDDWIFKIEKRAGVLKPEYFSLRRPPYTTLDNSMIEKKEELGINNADWNKFNR